MTDELGFALLILIPIFSLFPLMFWLQRRERAEQDRGAAE
jgi:hypothetical protein